MLETSINVGIERWCHVVPKQLQELEHAVPNNNQQPGFIDKNEM